MRFEKFYYANTQSDEDCCMKENCENKATMFEEVNENYHDNVWCVQHAPKGCIPIIDKSVNS